MKINDFLAKLLLLQNLKWLIQSMINFLTVNGHALIIPKWHCADYFELSNEEQSACWNMVNIVKRILMQKFIPDGFNVGINVNEEAGQIIPHTHIQADTMIYWRC